jgi:DNA-binding transcriptional regulator LsrR (DeoR family)
VLRQSDILAELTARGINQGQIAEALGIARPNANKLFNPATKTGKTRTLTYDEGVTLIERFNLDQPDDVPVEPMAVPAARLAVQYVAQQLGVRIDPDDERVEDLAQDIRAYSEFVAAARIGENQDRAQGWLDGRRSRSPERA